MLLTSFTTLGFSQQPKAAKSAPSCDGSLWTFVYHPDRLPAKKDCRTITGKIRNFKAEADGDLHIRLVVDDKTLVNAKNDAEQGGALVAEPICQFKPTQTDAIQPCKNYKGPKLSMSQACPGAPSKSSAPAKGKEAKTVTCKNPPLVKITGFYTIDNDHGWMELHTVSKIELAGN